MIEHVGKRCYGCTACVNACPKKCIEMKSNDEGFLYPSTDESKCIHCGLCTEACPAITKPLSKSEKGGEAWAAYAKDNRTLQESSSGGVFSLLALKILAEGGVVYGAAFTEDYYSVYHIKVQTAEELVSLRSSKYIQSDPGLCFSDIKKQLDEGKKVLFSGTPCQVTGLKSYLKKEYESLLLVDVICHGVPSPAVWEKYLKDLESQMGKKVVSVNMRYKGTDTEKLSEASTEAEEVYYYREMEKDRYMNLFMKNICLRNSCYQCSVKGDESSSDLTIGDFWGVEKVIPAFANPKGVSLVLLHTAKGSSYFHQIKNDILSERVDYEKAILHNSAFDHSVERPSDRDCFFTDLKEMQWDQLYAKYCAPAERSITDRIKEIISKTHIWMIYRKIRYHEDLKRDRNRLRFGMMIRLRK